MVGQEPETTAPVSNARAEVVCCAMARRRLDDEGITLALTENKDGILAGPRQKLTAELRSIIKDAREGLIRELLFREAADYLQKHSHELYDEGNNFASEDLSRQREIYDERLNDAWHDSDLEEFKEELRDWLKSQIRLLYNSRPHAEGQDSDEELDERGASEQPALM